MYVYLKNGIGKYQAGFFHPATGQFVPESDHDTADQAAYRVSYLNGGGLARLTDNALMPPVNTPPAGGIRRPAPAPDPAPPAASEAAPA